MARFTTNDYGTPGPARADRTLRPLLLANHALHFASSVIVLGISGYFIAKFDANTHLRYWIGVAAVDTFFYLPSLFLPLVKTYKGYLAPLALTLSYLWLIAFVFASQDYDYNGGQMFNSPAGVDKPGLKRTLEAFAFIAFFTSLVGFFAEARLWDVQRVTAAHVSEADKHAAAPAEGAAPATV
ncbi:uncharacterized protein N0V89_011916 [Didymosphaeria variabile]|uniref:MARVEL domain-containing protein n=1 Tax=Didymosphaeria variabile TaxID=1932322 RepID=A0A9W9C565_9PLEO|nr:uncharacterized protein N0V89_011916 [Didymosphaeria variabile]KAJ4345781.1 hypothetical protein N0V89_011916 [Didymosphaeria variabile]